MYIFFGPRTKKSFGFCPSVELSLTPLLWGLRTKAINCSKKNVILNFALIVKGLMKTRKHKCPKTLIKAQLPVFKTLRA